jgi:putative addiction module component (TIGR02574 family)
MAAQLEDILKLSVSERILWAEALWNSIATEKKSGELMEVSPEHKKILDEELSAYKNDSSSGSSWNDVKSRIRKKR